MTREHKVKPGDVVVFDGVKMQFMGSAQGINVLMLPDTVDEPKDEFSLCKNSLVLTQTIEDWVSCAN